MSQNYTSISSIRRTGPEAEPIRATPSGTEKAVIPVPLEVEAKPSVEQVDATVTAHPEVVSLTEEIRAAGVEAVGTPTPPGPTLPRGDEEIYEDLDKSIEDPARWFGEQCKKVLLAAGYLLKKVHGHVTRIATKQ